ncbi:uncharacterized protein PITG_13833 [Phytophthora infestans T30-4]|uniref:ACB domain-containing protein n=1 Tax=Phytophthora infestans (strain T30-4) TaxID=403677 RepID=D0NMW6_PHYIT|nr:uncharacterized protein PITG_13833 [Phytophthora infestans T30-4]EEY61873.1 conserved hypothetical protein [Phytophthora infestans T30-4]|eukprot:XP_002899513.1 conserved hypothetical protein [Phytophthora infestans T30-4]
MAEVFERAAVELKTANVAVSDADKLQLYGLFKQAMMGDCRTAAPSAFRPVERAKCWHKLNGTSQQDAKRQYVQLLSPLLWFALGYAIVIVLRSKVGSSFKTRRRRRTPVESELNAFLRKHGVHIVRQPEEGYTAPRLMLKLPEDQAAFQFGDHNATIPYSVEQTADVYYRKFKEPLPDLASRLLDSIEVLEERHLEEYCAVYKRRLLRFRNEAPSLIKRFASSDYVEYVEDSLLDQQNRLFYVYVKNESFQSLGVLEDFSVYEADADKSHLTHLHQFCRVHITSSSLSFFRSQIESFISNFYCKNAPDARSYHLQRITEEFGEPAE